MQKVSKGDVVGRISYGNDILFIVDRIIHVKNLKIAILKGVTIRIEADAPISDLQRVNKHIIKATKKTIKSNIEERIEHIRSSNRIKEEKFYTGRILHLDGDKRYSEKSGRYYKKMGLHAIVKNIPEYKQPLMVKSLLDKYNPDILVITGHDAMLKKGTNYSNIYNYRNSKNFINTVQEARKWAKSSSKLVIFAGACQSFFEALIEAGADFASSPGRILIDFVDPLIVAEKIALTDSSKFVSSYDISREIKEGAKGISGIGAMGKSRRNVTKM